MAMEVEIRRPVESNALTRLGTAAGGRGLRRRCCAIHDETVVELQHCCVAWIAGEAPGVRPISGLLRGDEASVGLEYMERVELPRAASARQPAAAPAPGHQRLQSGRPRAIPGCRHHEDVVAHQRVAVGDRVVELPVAPVLRGKSGIAREGPVQRLAAARARAGPAQAGPKLIGIALQSARLRITTRPRCTTEPSRSVPASDGLSWLS